MDRADEIIASSNAVRALLKNANLDSSARHHAMSTIALNDILLLGVWASRAARHIADMERKDAAGADPPTP